jgi:hypothetical protein
MPLQLKQPLMKLKYKMLMLMMQQLLELSTKQLNYKPIDSLMSAEQSETMLDALGTPIENKQN